MRSRRIPLLGIAMSLFLGIICAKYFCIGQILNLCFCLLILISILHAVLRNRMLAFGPLVVSLFIYITCFFLGVTLVRETVNVDLNEEEQTLVLLSEFKNVKQTTKGWRFEAIGKQMSNRENHSEFGVLCYTQDTEFIAHANDVVMCRVELRPIVEPNLPYQFNAKRFYNRKGIVCRGRIDQWVCYPSTELSLRERSEQARDNLTTILSQLDQAKAGILKAMLVGDKEALDSEIKEGFIYSGTIHMLVVSGLHVGVVFLLVNSLFFWLKKGVTKYAIAIMAIWSYLLLIGFPTPALRAAIMFTIVLVGKIIKRDSHVINSVVLSAMLMVIAHPQSLYSLSFQYSYAAVLGIVTVYPILNKMIRVSDWLSAKVISLLLVSLCAQLFTTPLGIYYFNQFPTYSLAANLVILPLMIMEFYLGVALLHIGPWVPILQDLIVLLINSYLDVIISINKGIASLDNALIRLPSNTAFNLVGFYLLVCLVFVGYKRRQILFIYIAGCMLVVLWFIPNARPKDDIHLVDYRGGKVAVICTENSAYILGESEGLLDDDFYRYSISPIMVNLLIKNEYRISTDLRGMSAQIGQLIVLQSGVYLVGSKLLVLGDEKSSALTNPNSGISAVKDGRIEFLTLNLQAAKY